jgi:hypothetical protein
VMMFQYLAQPTTIFSSNMNILVGVYE